MRLALSVLFLCLFAFLPFVAIGCGPKPCPTCPPCPCPSPVKPNPCPDGKCPVRPGGELK